MITLKSVKTKLLPKVIIVKICKLKNSHWKKGINSQIKFFKKNSKPNDINNLLYFNKNLIGYTLLRRRKFYEGFKKKNYFYFDTLIINKKFRDLRLSVFLMNFNNYIIKKNNLNSFLVCEKKLINFYKKFNWKLENKKKIKINDLKKNKNVMSYNYEKKVSKKILLNT